MFSATQQYGWSRTGGQTTKERALAAAIYELSFQPGDPEPMVLVFGRM